MPRARIVVAAFATFAGLTLGVGTGASAQTLKLKPTALPQVNLQVAWRLDAVVAPPPRTQVQGGQVVVDSRGTVIGRTGVGATVVQTEGDVQAHTEQQLQVLNGQQARLFTGQQVARQSWQLVWSPQGVGAVGGGSGGSTAAGGGTSGSGTGTYGIQSQTAWVDLGEGLVVRPRWPGGRQAVLLDIEARSSRALAPGRAGALGSSGFDPDGQVGRTELATTLRLPLGEWTMLARSGASGTRSASASGLSTRSLDDTGAQALWVRVSLPGGEPAP
jgi:type II secretory pathway component GspD/PulD (secretin)